MHLLNLFHEYATDVIVALAAFSIVIEVVPIKINPWTWLLKQVGNRLNADIVSRMGSIEKQLVEQDKKIDSNEKDHIRYEILAFANSCRCKKKHTKEEFDHILEQYDKYEIIMAKLEQPNGKVTQAMKYVTVLYNECQKQNDFL